MTDEAVQAVIEERLGDYLRSGRAVLAEHDTPDEGASYEITPSNPRSALIWINVEGDEVSLAIGNGSFELWGEPDWRESLPTVLDAVATGRYREEIRKGWLFERKLRMHFDGTDLHPSYARLSYSESETPPEPGEISYDAW